MGWLLGGVVYIGFGEVLGERGLYGSLGKVMWRIGIWVGFVGVIYCRGLGDRCWFLGFLGFRVLGFKRVGVRRVFYDFLDEGVLVLYEFFLLSVYD